MELTLERSRRQFYELLDRIDCGIINQCDGFLVREPVVPVLKHYFTYAGKNEDGIRFFFITMASIGKVKLMDENELFEMAMKYKFTLEKHIPFIGNDFDREAAFERGMACVGKPYSWVGKNCENLMNYIQTGKSKSVQTRNFAGGVAVAGGLMMCSKNKGIKYAGGTLTLIGLFVLLFDFFGENKF